MIEAQQSAIAPLSSYLRGLDVNIQDLELNEKLLAHALSCEDPGSQLRFIHDGLGRAISWYNTQLLDRQLAADPALGQLLVQLGEIDAAKLWHTEAIMAMLSIPVKVEERKWDDRTQPEPKDLEEWRPRLVEDVGRPSWGGRQA